MAPQIAQDVASRVRFALTQVVLGIDFSRSAVPTHSSPAVVSTEPGPSTRKPHAGGTMKSKKLNLHCSDDRFRRTCDTVSIDRTADSLHRHKPRHLGRQQQF